MIAGDPVAVALPVPMRQLSSGGGETCGIGTDGLIRCWGTGYPSVGSPNAAPALGDRRERTE